jgi:hypothetical protein
VLLLLWTSERRRIVAASLAIVAAVGLLLPIAARQAEHGHASWIAEQPLGERLERAGAKLVGNDNGNEHGARQPGPLPLALPAGLAVIALALLALAGDRSERRSAVPAAAVGTAGIAAPLALGAAGADYLDGRNLLPVFVPLILVLAAGFGVRRYARAGLLAAAAFCFCSLVFTIEIDRLPRLQREDLRNAAHQVGPLRPDKAVVTIRYSANMPLRYYLDAEPARQAPPPLREIDLVGSATAAQENARRLLPSSFRQVDSRPVSYNFTLTRYISARPRRVPLRLLERGVLVGGAPRAAVLLSGSR